MEKGQSAFLKQRLNFKCYTTFKEMLRCVLVTDIYRSYAHVDIKALLLLRYLKIDNKLPSLVEIYGKL